MGLLAKKTPVISRPFALLVEDRKADASFGTTTGVASMSIAYQHVEDSELNTANETPWAS